MHRARAATARLLLPAFIVTAGWVLWPTAVGGYTSYVTTHGISMEPGFSQGDLAVLRKTDEYRVGDVAAYRSHLLRTVVLHRIAGVEGGHYTFQGDNNPWVDPERPTRSDMIGTLRFRVPEGGIWLHRAINPLVLGAATCLLLGIGGTATRRHRRSRGRPTTVSGFSRDHPQLTGLTRRSLPEGRILALAAMILGGLGLFVGAVAFTRPTMTTTSVADTQQRSMTFSYSATVPRTAAYDGTTVKSPDPVFRKLADAVAVHYRYEGEPGRLGVAVELTASSGWRSTIPGDPPVPVGRRHTGTVDLDLDAIDARAQAAERATGVPTGPLTVTVRTTVDTPDSVRFAPELPLSVSPLTLVTESGTSMRVADDNTVTRPRPVAKVFHLGRLGAPITTLRYAAGGLFAVSALAAGLLVLLAHRRTDISAAELVRRSLRGLVVDVDPIRPGHLNRPVDVTDPDALVRIAGRFDTFVLTWADEDGDHFVVRDRGTTYRYRATCSGR